MCNSDKLVCESSQFTHMAALFDAFAYACPHFTTKTDVNNGYGCNHVNHDNTGYDYEGKACGNCMLGGCPLGHSADDESLKDPSIDWQGDTPQPGDIEDEYIIINIGPNASEEERVAANNYIRYINRYTPKEEA